MVNAINFSQHCIADFATGELCRYFDALAVPEGLGFNKIEAVLGLVAGALSGVELEVNAERLSFIEIFSSKKYIFGILYAYNFRKEDPDIVV
jgi:hypothetical protein